MIWAEEIVGKEIVGTGSSDQAGLHPQVETASV
jgi:hypothetical protein